MDTLVASGLGGMYGVHFKPSHQGARSNPRSQLRRQGVTGSSLKPAATYVRTRRSFVVSAASTDAQTTADVQETDVVVVGSGVGGLSCAGILSMYGNEVTVCESHYHPGGVAHAFKVGGYNFDSGPSLYTGISKFPSVNPLGQVLHALDEPLECVTYDTWICYLPEGTFVCKTNAEKYSKELGRLGGPGAEDDWKKLEKFMEPLGRAAAGLPAAALRFDPLVPLTILKFLPSVIASGPQAAMLQNPFKDLIEKVGVKNAFIRNMMDLECFVLSGVPADGTITAEMAFMYGERNRKGSTIDYPIGGAEAVINALVRGMEKHGGKLLLRSHVDEILIENGRAAGVRLSDGRVIKARKAVVSNASVWDTQKLLPPGSVPSTYRKKAQETPECDSFLHLHLGIDATGLPDDLECHHVIVNDWSKGVDSEQNVVIISIPTVFDPKLAPEGKHAVHAYVAGCEPYDVWKGMDRKSEEYKQLKEERAEVLWKALEKVIPDIRARTELKMIGTPLTHERFNRRNRGSYGPAIKAGEGTFPGPGTPIPGLYCCGDSTQPGIGLPAVAASGMIAANTMSPVTKQWELLDKIKA
mmetsp:Transcript_10336/g.21556  ORF Transcript_10336/g.21556 Transcript_10336/m.21556 type:complete len:583 (-) Transcript_10336:1049-2797(-)